MRYKQRASPDVVPPKQVLRSVSPSDPLLTHSHSRTLGLGATPFVGVGKKLDINFDINLNIDLDFNLYPLQPQHNYFDGVASEEM